MKNILSISNARKELPRLVREIQKNPQTVFQISVRNETIAEIRSAKAMVAPGEAVRKLLDLRKSLSVGKSEKAGSHLLSNQRFFISCLSL
jgi:hypothetical protein